MSINSLNNADAIANLHQAVGTAPRTVPGARQIDNQERTHRHEERQAAKVIETKPVERQIELRVGVVPNTDVITFRFVDANTGQVVREFPPEKLAEALAEIRARATAHLDKTA